MADTSGATPGPAEVERLNPDLSTVQIGDRLQLILQLNVGSPDYLRELVFTAFPFLGTAGAHLDLGPYLMPDPSTAAFDYADGSMTIEADVIRESSPGVLLLVVISAALIGLAALFPSATIVLVNRIRRAAQEVGAAAGGVVGGVVGGATSGVASGLGVAGWVALAGVGLLLVSGPGRELLKGASHAVSGKLLAAI